MTSHFSIIIPHKGTPDLLKRCLDSIPKRDDIQVIVVEDVWGKGAGYVRNQGLKKATGKWLLFSDADDWFTDKFNSLLDSYVDSDADIVYFRPKSALNESSERVNHILYLFENGNEKLLRYMYITPWSKLIKRSLVVENNFWFDEVRWGNDAFFMTQVATTANKIVISDGILYIVDEVKGSITHTAGCEKEELVCRTKVDIRCYEYADSIGFNPPDEVLFYRIRECINNRYWWLLFRTLKSLPLKARHSIKERYLCQINFRGQVVVRLAELLSSFVKKL
ncbi:glycosyltransferase family 2 protein [Phocaeicola vulgatus]|uniref:glycosyltransferase family 2 protein n=1 Tax=Phocaeicola vulgatus TaxID=821 RepID=UPI0032C0B45D